MENVLHQYAAKLVRAGLTEGGGALIGLRGAQTLWSRQDEGCAALETVMAAIDKQAILFAEPAEPYRTIIEYLAETSGGVIEPRDFETRFFLHDLPVLQEFAPRAVTAALKRRRSVVITGRGVITFGKTSPDAAFVIYSSVCFACFVKFFSDTLYHIRRNSVDHRRREVMKKVLERLDPPPATTGTLMRGPFTAEAQILAAMEQTGRLMVERRLVDSNFGNISYFAEPLLYISPKGGALDELRGRIVPVSLADAAAPTERASTEFPAHRDIVLATGRRAVLHGHPKFAVILSMDCEKDDCEGRDSCHIRCPQERFVCDIPVVAGEAGAGPFGLCHTVPPAMRDHSGVIVYGHGLFTAGKHDFKEAFERLAAIENTCRQEYFRRINHLI
ncbi:MAG: rRNA adenine dimethylase [Syntrophus sp. (in: bacteria)]|nr:rRNA adenine dimethylase [Syntrophus sp. (in: bacteria)]